MDCTLAPRFLVRQLGLALVDLDGAITHFDVLLLWLVFLQMAMEQWIPLSFLVPSFLQGSLFPLLCLFSLVSLAWAHGRFVTALRFVLITIVVVHIGSEFLFDAFVVVFSASCEFQLGLNFLFVGFAQDLVL